MPPGPIPRDELSNLCEKCTGRCFQFLTIQILLIVAAISLSLWNGAWWIYLISVFIIGSRQYALGEVLVHDASHGNLSSNRRINNVLGTALSWLFLFTFQGYRRFHLQHHNLSLGDPENSIYEQYEDWRLPISGSPLSTLHVFWLLILRPIFGIVAFFQAYTTVSDLYWDRDFKENSFMFFTWVIGLIIFWQVGILWEFFIYWVVPYFYVFATMNYWSEISDHYRCGVSETRTYIGWGWNRLFGGNLGYHIIHHKYPGIPWFNLRIAHQKYGSLIGGQIFRDPVQIFKQIRDDT